MERDSSSMSSGCMQRKDGKDRTDSVDATDGGEVFDEQMHFLSDFLGNNQLRIVRDDFGDMIIHQMNGIPKNQNFRYSHHFDI
jgi:hypothetical protein